MSVISHLATFIVEEKLIPNSRRVEVLKLSITLQNDSLPQIIDILIIRCFFILSIFCCLTARADDLRLNLHDEVYPEPVVSRYVSYYQDDTKELTIKDFLQPHSFQFEHQRSSGFGPYRGVVWTKLDIVNQVSIQDWYFEVQHPLLDSISLYIIHDGEVVYHSITGDDFVFANRPVAHRNFIFPFSLIPGEPYTCIIRAQADQSTLRIPIQIGPKERVENLHNIEHLFFGAYFGLLIIVVLLGLTITSIVRKPVYAYYTLSAFSVLIFVLSQTGYLYQYIIPEWTIVFNYISSNVVLVGLLFMVLFVSRMLKLKETSRSLYLIYIGMIGITVVHLLLRLMTRKIPDLIFIFSVLSLPIFITSGVVTWRKGSRIAPYLVIGWFCYLFGGIVLGLRNFGILPSNFVTNYSLFLAALIEVLFFGVAILLHYIDLTKSINRSKMEIRLSEIEVENERLKSRELLQQKELKDRQMLSLSMKSEQQKEAIVAFKESLPNTTLRNRIERMLQDNGAKNYSWENFKTIFEDVHPNFFLTIQNQYPQLTVNDLRQLAYLKLNLKVKEIASMTGLSIDAVKKSRTRLRKKLELEENLSAFVQRF